MRCPNEYCEDGKVPVLYCEMSGVSCSNERAAELAGDVHHYEDCETCGGTGEIEE